MPDSRSTMPPILADKHYDTPSAFTPENLLRKACRQKALSAATVPAVCVLDPDSDLVRRLVADGAALRDVVPAVVRGLRDAGESVSIV